jgi:hypothetical protein
MKQSIQFSLAHVKFAFVDVNANNASSFLGLTAKSHGEADSSQSPNGASGSFLNLHKL